MADAGGKPEPEPRRDLVLLAAGGLDRSYRFCVWLAPPFAAVGGVAVIALTRGPAMAPTAIVAPVLVTFALFPLLVAWFYRSRFPRIVAQALQDPGAYLAGQVGLVPARVAVFSDGAYSLAVAWVVATAVAVGLVAGGKYSALTCVVQVGPAVAGAMAAAAWSWSRYGRPELLRQLALADAEALPTRAEWKAWAQEHRSDDCLLPVPEPLDPAVVVSDTERAVFEREMEVSNRMRRGWLQLGLCAAPPLAMALNRLSAHLAVLGVVVLIQGLVAALCVYYGQSKQVQHIGERPRWFVYMRTRRPRRREHQRIADPIEGIVKVLFLIAFAGLVAYCALSEMKQTDWQWGCIAVTLFPFAAFNLLDAISWHSAAWPRLSERVGVSAGELMLRLNYHWSWLRGWRKYGIEA